MPHDDGIGSRAIQCKLCGETMVLVNYWGGFVWRCPRECSPYRETVATNTVSDSAGLARRGAGAGGGEATNG